MILQTDLQNAQEDGSDSNQWHEKIYYISLLVIITWATVDYQQEVITGNNNYQTAVYYLIEWMV